MMKINFYRILVLLIVIVTPMLVFISCEPNSIEADAPNAFLKFYGGKDDQEGFSLKQTPDGGFIVLGSTKSFGRGGWDIYLVKVDKAGNEEWSKTYGGPDDDRGKSILVEEDGSYIVLGDLTRPDTIGSVSTNIDMYLMRISQSGVQLDSATFYNSINIDNPGVPIDNDTDEIAKEIQKTLDGGYVMVGSTTKVDNNENAPRDFYLVKTFADFSVDWENAKGFPGEDIANSVVQFDASTFLLTGSTADGVNASTGDLDMFVAKVKNDFGANVGKINFGTTNIDVGNRIIKTSAGFAIISTTYSGNTKNAFLSTINSNGDELIASKYTRIGNGINEGNDIQLLDDGFIIMGTTTTNTGMDFYLTKTDMNGVIIWEKEIGGERGDDEGVAVIAVDNGFVLLGTTSFEDNTMINLIKTNIEGDLIR